MDSMDQFLEKTRELKKDDLRQEYEKISSHEMRNAYLISEVSKEQRSYYDVDASKEETLKIKELLDKREELNLSKKDVKRLYLRYGRNRNFEFVNQEKWGGDSGFMTTVKDCIREYENLIRSATDGTVEGATAKVEEAVRLCNNIVAACSDYLKRGPSIFFWRWKRYSAVADTMERIRLEKEMWLSEAYLKNYEQDIKKGDSILTLVDDGILEERCKKRLETLKAKEELKKKNESSEQKGNLHLDAPTDEELKAVRKNRNEKSRVEYLDECVKNGEELLNTVETAYEEDIIKFHEKMENKEKKRVENEQQFEKKTSELTDEQIKEKAKNKTKDFESFTIEYDRAEKEKNDAAFKEQTKKLTEELNSLKAKESLSPAEKQRVAAINQELTRMAHNKITDHKVYARNALPMDVKKHLSFGSLQDISAFMPLLEKQDEKTAQDNFKSLVSEYSTGDKTKALDKMFAMIEKVEIKPEEFLTNDAIALHMEKYISLSDMVEGIKRLMESEPQYFTGREKQQEKLKTLSALSDYVRVKKQILLSPAYIGKNEITLDNYGKKRDGFKNAHHRRLLMVSEVLERNMRKRLGLPMPEGTALKKKTNKFAEEDRQYALRLSEEPELQKEVPKNNAYREDLVLEINEVVAKIKNCEANTKSKNEDVKDKAVSDIMGLKLQLKELLRRVRQEDAKDPANRISEALLRLEEERFRVPFDFNETDFSNIPEEQRKDILGICAIQANLSDEDSDITPGNALCKKFGYEGLEKWIKTVKDEYTNDGQALVVIRFPGVGDISFSDNYDRIVTHFKGSFHFHRTDAEMREQMAALAFGNSYHKKTYEDDKEAMSYQRSMFEEMVLRLNSQVSAATYRNLYGGVINLTYMTPLDRLMSMNAYNRSDLMSANTYSNVDESANVGAYTEFMYKANKDKRYIPLTHDIISIGGQFGLAVLPVHDSLNERGLESTGALTPEQEQEYRKFEEEYKKANPEASRSKIGIEFLLRHPEFWTQRGAYTDKNPDPEREADRKNTMRTKVSMQLMSDDLQNLLNYKAGKRPTKEELLQYKKRALDQGFEKYDKVVDAMMDGFKGTNPIKFATELYED